MSGRLARAMLFVSTWLFPVIGFPLLVYAWRHVAAGDWRLVALVMAVPVAFGYAMPALATNVAKRWRMTSGPRMGGQYAHHGFVYAAKLSLVLLLAMHELSAFDSWIDAVCVVLLVGAATAFGGWWHDVHAVRQGRIAVEARDGRTSEETLASFAPPTYFTMGATYAAATILAWRAIAADASAVWWALPAAFVALCIVPSLAFFALDPSALRMFRKTEPKVTRP